MGFGIPDFLFWLVAALLFFLVEALTVNLVSIWFVLGSLCAALSARLGAGRPIQALLFLAASLVFLAIFWNKRDRIALMPGRTARTNADRILGETGVVQVAIDPVAGLGQIRVLDQVWSATTETGEPVPAGTRVEVRALRGVKAVVRVCPAEGKTPPQPGA